MLPHRSTRTSPGSNFDPTLSLQTGVGFDYILVRMFTLLTIFMLGVQSLTVELAPFVLANSRSLPPKASVWVGEAPHYFLGGQATLFCGSHGVISGTGDPPDRQGQTSVIQYNAIFSGELTLNLGGGIVADSVPAAELEETRDKGRDFARLWGLSG